MSEQSDLYPTLPSAVFREEKNRFSLVFETNLYEFGFVSLGTPAAEKLAYIPADPSVSLARFRKDSGTRKQLRHKSPPRKQRKGTYRLNNMWFHSRSEAACAILMELFIPDFKIKEGETFQIQLGKDQYGNPLSADFLVRGAIFEYHPPQLSNRAFKKDKKLRGYIRKQRKRYARLGKTPSAGSFQRLTEWYYRKRRAQVDRCKEHRGRKLIVASSPEEFFHRVIRRYGHGPMPSKAEFLELFRQLQGRAEARAPKQRRTRNRSRRRNRQRIRHAA